MKTKPKLPNDETTSSLIVIIGVALVIILAIAFFVNRPNDLGQFSSIISQFAASFSSGKILSSEVLKNQLGAMFIGFGVVLSWAGIGALIVRALNLNYTSRSFNLTLGAALGASFWSLIWFILGSANLLKSPVAMAVLIVGTGLGVLEIFRQTKNRYESESVEKSRIN